jgi:hypothetical protein
MEHKYQWSLFVDQCKTEQFVIRCDDPTEFLEGMQMVNALLTRREPAQDMDVEPLIPPDQCILHNVTMKKRQSKNGGEWYDHRWQENEVWHVCNGMTIRAQ